MKLFVGLKIVFFCRYKLEFYQPVSNGLESPNSGDLRCLLSARPQRHCFGQLDTKSPNQDERQSVMRDLLAFDSISARDLTIIFSQKAEPRIQPLEYLKYQSTDVIFFSMHSNRTVH